MSYNIFSKKAPVMPKPGKGTEFCKAVLSQVSKDMQEPLLPMVIPAVSAHLSEVEFMYNDNMFYELSGQFGHLIAPSGVGKGQFTHLVNAVMRSFREHDEMEYKRLVDWQRQVKTKAANKEKPERPDVSFWFPPADMTNAAFIQNAMACEEQGNRTQYINLSEVETLDRLCGSHKKVSTTVRDIYDCQRGGALRATADGVTGNPVLRVDITMSSTPDTARAFYRKDMTNGFFGRIPFSYKGRGERVGRIPRQGKYDKAFLDEIDRYMLRLDNCKGRFVVKPLNKIADQLAAEMAKLADLADDDMMWELSHRSIFMAWKKGATLWILNDQTWTRSIGEFVEWFCYYDLWSKMQVFGDMFKGGELELEESQKSGPKNILDIIEGASFNEQQLETLRVSLGKSKEGTKHQLSVWKNRGFITYSAQTGLYTKTKEYLGK